MVGSKTPKSSRMPHKKEKSNTDKSIDNIDKSIKSDREIKSRPHYEVKKRSQPFV